MTEKIIRIKNKYRYTAVLLKQLVITDFKMRYQNSVLGYLWSLLRPLALFVTLYLVFVKFLKVGSTTPNYPVYLLLGIILWNFFTEVTVGSIASIVAKGDLIRKINFPKYVIVLSGSFSALINLVLNFIVVSIFMFISKVDIGVNIVYVPLLLAQLFILSLALAFFLSASFVRFRDVTYIWEVLIQAAFYATPILYPVTSIPVGIAKWLLLNPVAQIIQDFRYILITDQTVTIGKIYTNEWMRVIPILITILVAVLSIRRFRRLSISFAENV